MTSSDLRPELSSHLAQRLAAFADGFRQNLALIGPRGSGKSFQLQRLDAAASPSLLLLHCPLYRESSRQVVLRLASGILRTGCDGSSSASEESWESLLRQAEPQIPQTVAALRAIEPLLGRRAYGEALIRSLDAIPILSQERGKPCVVIMDEFLLLEDVGLAHGFHELGKRVMTWPSVLFVLSSSSCYRARLILRERLQLLFGQFELLTLEAVNPTTAIPWVQQELRGVRGAKAMAPFLVQWLGGYPWYLSTFCRRLKELDVLSRRPDAAEALFLQTAWDLLGRSEGPLHQWCRSKVETLTRNRLGLRAMDALVHIAGGCRTATEIGKRLGRSGLTEGLQLLVEQDLAQRNGSCWIVTDPILRCWLSTACAAERGSVGPDSRELRTRFDQYLRSLWSTWVQTHELSFIDQVIGLFEKFRDETVSLDAKIGRLPTFRAITTHRVEPETAGAYLIASGDGKRWCASVHEEGIDEETIARFETFCRAQAPKPARKIVITRSRMDPNARLVAKAANMWVWEGDDLTTLMGLYEPIETR